MGAYYLVQKDPITVYFKCKDKTGRTSTSYLPDAMRFNSRDEAIDYNHEHLYGEYEVCKHTA